MKLSIILPVYNGVHYLKQALDSIQAQTFKDWELLVIDDGSTDGTAEMLKSLKEPRLKIISNPKNLGLQKTLNIGLRAAQGDYIARLDCDDAWISSDKLEKQIKLLEADPQLMLVGTGWQVIDKEGRAKGQIIPASSDRQLRRQLLSFNPFCHSAVVFRRQASLQAGGYDERPIAKYQEDYGLWLELGRLGKLANLPEIAVRYLDNESGEARKNDKKHYLSFKSQILWKHGRYYPNLGAAIIRWFSYLLFY